MTIKVNGISSKGTERTMMYEMFEADVFQAITAAVRYANREYTCEYDENLKPIPNTEYKEFETITSIEAIDD